MFYLFISWHFLFFFLHIQNLIFYPLSHLICFLSFYIQRISNIYLLSLFLIINLFTFPLIFFLYAFSLLQISTLFTLQIYFSYFCHVLSSFSFWQDLPEIGRGSLVGGDSLLLVNLKKLEISRWKSYKTNSKLQRMLTKRIQFFFSYTFSLQKVNILCILLYLCR